MQHASRAVRARFGRLTAARPAVMARVRLFVLLLLLLPLFAGLQYLVQEGVPRVENRFVSEDVPVLVPVERVVERIVERVVYVPEPPELDEDAAATAPTIQMTATPGLTATPGPTVTPGADAGPSGAPAASQPGGVAGGPTVSGSVGSPGAPGLAVAGPGQTQTLTPVASAQGAPSQGASVQGAQSQGAPSQQPLTSTQPLAVAPPTTAPPQGVRPSPEPTVAAIAEPATAPTSTPDPGPSAEDRARNDARPRPPAPQGVKER